MLDTNIVDGARIPVVTRLAVRPVLANPVAITTKLADRDFGGAFVGPKAPFRCPYERVLEIRKRYRKNVGLEPALGNINCSGECELQISTYRDGEASFGIVLIEVGGVPGESETNVTFDDEFARHPIMRPEKQLHKFVGGCSRPDDVAVTHPRITHGRRAIPPCARRMVVPRGCGSLIGHNCRVRVRRGKDQTERAGKADNERYEASHAPSMIDCHGYAQASAARARAELDAAR